MHLGFHGGKCCGIKVIYGFWGTPSIKVDSLAKLSKENNHDANGDLVRSDLRFFHEEAPEETYLERLDRYIDYVKRRRPQHIIEVTLAKSKHGHLDQSAWFPVLEERGFRLVNSCPNSNSGNVVHVFHLNIGE